MKTKILVFIIILIGRLTLTSAVDPFYVQMLEQGKSQYFDNQFEKALESFRIAEFGLLVEKEYVKDICIFSALCYFKLKRTGEVQEMLEKIERELKVTDISALAFPEQIRKDMEILLSIFRKGKPLKTVVAAAGPGKNIALLSSFAEIFSSAREYIKASQYDKAEIEIKKLKRINKKDIRIDFLQASICFEKKKYRDCIERLIKVFRANPPDLRDEVLYYLVISHYFVKNYGQTLAFFQKLENPLDKQKLNAIIEKVKSERQQMVDRVATRFGKKVWEELSQSFSGDSAIARDVLTMAMNTPRLNDPVIAELVEICSQSPGACDLEFYLNASDYYKKIKKVKSGIAFLKKSRYYMEKKEENVEIYYQLGMLYFQMKDWNKAMIELAKVKAINPGYKKSDQYIENIQKLNQGG